MLNSSVKEIFGCKPQIPGQLALKTKMAETWGPIASYKTPTEVGIEIEIEKITNYGKLFLFKVDKDGSLKDNGFEFISCPLKDENVLYAMKEYEEAVVLASPTATFSHRCSVHVHINVSKLSMGQLRALIATYLVVEPYFFFLCEDHRAGNSYCYPLGDTGITWDMIDPNIVTKDFKYAALNVHHLHDYGTLEFRQFGGSLDSKKILNWIETVLCLYKFVEKFSLEEIEKDIRGLNTISNYSAFVISVFQNKYPQFDGMNHHKVMRNTVLASKVFLG